MFTFFDDSGTVGFSRQLREDAVYCLVGVVGGIAVILCDLDFRKSCVAYRCQCKTMTGQFLDCTATDLPLCR